jgi:hypothetical protein
VRQSLFKLERPGERELVSQLATPIMVHPIILTINFSLNRRGGAEESAKRILEECRIGLLSFYQFKRGWLSPHVLFKN